MSKDEALSIRIRADLKADLKKLAAADQRGLAAFVQIALDEAVAAKKTLAKRRRWEDYGPTRTAGIGVSISRVGVKPYDNWRRFDSLGSRGPTACANGAGVARGSLPSAHGALHLLHRASGERRTLCCVDRRRIVEDRSWRLRNLSKVLYE
jgi:hypothetical protein